MSMTEDDYVREEAIALLGHEAVMRAATIAQCIYVFVEGESEEQAFPILLERAGIDLVESGFVIANYNGIGNLKHALRLLSQTLSHDRPVMVTYDNDEKGSGISAALSKKLKLDLKLTNFFPVPAHPVVRYSNGHSGGSFEEAFDAKDFINACFHDSVMDDELLMHRSEFEELFDVSIPWFSQVVRFCHTHSHTGFISRKIELAVVLAENCVTIPITFLRLAERLHELRKQFPVKHPEDVKLPRVLGLTC